MSPPVQYCVYMLASKRNGTLYVGVTNDLSRRAWEHKEQCVPGFTKRYGVHILVWYEVHAHINDAIARETDQGMESSLEITADRKGKFRLE